MSPESGVKWLVSDTFRECDLRNPGEEERGAERLELEIRDWNRLSKGRKDGVGLSRPGLEASEGLILLPPGEDNTEPCGEVSRVKG